MGAVSSTGRAFGLHPKGHRFETCTAHFFHPFEPNGLRSSPENAILAILIMSRSTSFKDIQKTLDLVGQELSILHQISQTISVTLDLDKVLHQIIDLVIET